MPLKIQEFDPRTVTIDPAIIARKGEPSKKKIEEMAANFLARRDAGRNHQIQPGLVRMQEGVPQVVAGRHRLGACQYITNGTGEVLPFQAIVVDADNLEALIDSIEENEWRNATDAFDRADAMAKLKDLKPDVTQEEIAAHFHCSQSLVSDILRVGKLPAKYRKMVRDGQLTEEAAIRIARYSKDPKAQEEVLELSQATRAAMDAIAERAEAKANAETEAEAEQAEEQEADGKAKSKKVKGAPRSEAVKGKGRTAAKGRVTAEDVQTAEERRTPKKKTAKKQADTGRSKRALLTFMEALVQSDDYSQPVKDLCSKIEEYLDGEVGERGLASAFERCCKEK